MSLTSSIRPYGRHAEREKFRLALGSEIAAVRKAKGIKAQACALAAGISRQAWSMYESGRALPSAWMLFRLADVLGCSIDKLRPLHDCRNKEVPRGRHPFKDTQLTRKERYCLRWLCAKVPGLTEGGKFRTEAILPRGDTNRNAMRQRIRRLEERGYLIFTVDGLRLSKAVQDDFRKHGRYPNSLSLT